MRAFGLTRDRCISWTRAPHEAASGRPSIDLWHLPGEQQRRNYSSSDDDDSIVNTAQPGLLGLDLPSDQNKIVTKLLCNEESGHPRRGHGTTRTGGARSPRMADKAALFIIWDHHLSFIIWDHHLSPPWRSNLIPHIEKKKTRHKRDVPHHLTQTRATYMDHGEDSMGSNA